MMQSFDPVALQKLKSDNDLVTVIGAVVPLRRVGSVYRGACPWCGAQAAMFVIDSLKTSNLKTIIIYKSAVFRDIFKSCSLGTDCHPTAFIEGTQIYARLIHIGHRKNTATKCGSIYHRIPQNRFVKLTVFKTSQIKYGVLEIGPREIKSRNIFIFEQHALEVTSPQIDQWHLVSQPFKTIELGNLNKCFCCVIHICCDHVVRSDSIFSNMWCHRLDRAFPDKACKKFFNHQREILFVLIGDGSECVNCSLAHAGTVFSQHSSSFLITIKPIAGLRGFALAFHVDEPDEGKGGANNTKQNDGCISNYFAALFVGQNTGQRVLGPVAGDEFRNNPYDYCEENQRQKLNDLGKGKLPPKRKRYVNESSNSCDDVSIEPDHGYSVGKICCQRRSYHNLQLVARRGI